MSPTDLDQLARLIAYYARRQGSDAMPPWEELGYLQEPEYYSAQQSTLTLNTVLKPDPQRVALIASSDGGTATYTTLGTDPTLQAGGVKGFLLQLATGPLVIYHRDFPGLPQRAWYATAGGGTPNLHIETVRLRTWPKGE